MKRIISVLAFLFFSISLFAQKVEITPVDFNSGDDDFSSCLTQQGRFIYFTSTRKSDQQKIFAVKRTSGGWSSPSVLNDEVNNGEQVGSPTLTPDGQFMIFAAFEHGKGGQGRTDLYSARKIDGDWTAIRNLGPNVNSEYWDSQPSLSSDGQTLYFASDRPGGIGGTDIYISKKTKDGWSAAVNAGTEINTASDEMSPIIAPDNKTFYFASNREGGLGGFDIYVSKLSGTKFTGTKNAGEPINSAYNEFFYYSQVNTKIAYFSSDRPGSEGNIDIFMAVPNPYESEGVVLLSGVVKDAVSKDPLGSDIAVTDLKSGKRVADMRSDDKTGDYYVVLQPGKVYSITASKKGYVFYSERFEVPPSEKGHEENKDIELTPLTGGNTRLLVFFDFNKETLQEESMPELERIVEFLNDNPEIKIALEGHTDDVGSDEYNDKLSQNRANTVREYLIKAGIDKSRIKTKGFGKRKPLVDKKTDEARAMNRRVEMKIVND